MVPVAVLLCAAFAGGIPAVSGVITVEARDPVGPQSTPAVLLSAADRPTAFALECTTGGQTLKAHSGAVPAGTVHVVPLPRIEAVTTASCAVLGTFANGLAERRQVALSWTWAPPDGPDTETAAHDELISSEQPTPPPRAAPVSPH